MSAPSSPVLEVGDLRHEFPVRRGVFRRPRGAVRSLDGVSLAVARGETLAVVGESGCGKSTLVRCVLRLLEPTGGSVRFLGDELVGMAPAQLRRRRSRMQVVLQDPYDALNPRLTVGASVADPLQVQGLDGAARRDRVAALFARVGLDLALARRYPNELSGGQCQRVGIARALATDPELLVLDEPLSALDASVQAGVLDLLVGLQEELGLSLLLVTHDLGVARFAAHRVAVMHLGRVVETGPIDDVFDAPAHPYTQALLSAVPLADPAAERRRTRVLLVGDPPSATEVPSGCSFRTRCPRAQDVCAVEEPALVERGTGHPVACHFAEAWSPWASAR